MRGRNNNNNTNNHNNNSNNNNNRRGPNPLTRNYESNGPDVKIRGSAMQIAEKYMTLARDSHSSGDRVMSENYFQHAEHYNRIIAAAQAQMPTQQAQPRNDDFEDDADDRDSFDNSGNAAQPAPQANGPSFDSRNGPSMESRAMAPVDRGLAPQPVIEGIPAEITVEPGAPFEEGDRPNGRRLNGVRAASTEGDPSAGDPNEAPRRARRPRRPRRDPNAVIGSAKDMEDGSDPVSGNKDLGSEGGPGERADSATTTE